MSILLALIAGYALRYACERFDRVGEAGRVFTALVVAAFCLLMAWGLSRP